MICYEYKPKKRRIWRGRYQLENETRLTDISLHSRDRQVAKERLRKIVREKEQEREGMILPGSIRSAAPKNLVDHLDGYVADLDKAGRSESHVYHVEKRVKRLIAECSWHRCGDISSDSFQKWRVRQKGKSPKTLNEYLNSASSFCNWMVRQARIVGNPLKYVAKVNVKGNERVKRRALSDDETRRLLAVAGPRKVVYQTALCTGLRRGEMEALEWGDLDLDTAAPVIKLRASTTKNKRAAVLPIYAKLAEELKQHRPAVWLASDFVFADIIPSMKVFKNDLKAADVPFIDDQGQRIDFHALRKTYCTNLAIANVNPWLAMKLMRHSDINLTTKVYTDAGKLPLRESLGRLPDFFLSSPVFGSGKLEVYQAKGMNQNLECSHGRSQESGFSGQAVSLAGNDGEEGDPRESIDSIDESHDLALAGATSQNGRMAERGGFEPPVPREQYDGLANRCFRPLSHLSVSLN